MLKLLAVALPALAFLAAGVINAAGRTQGDFVRWGYPPGWGRLTGGLEILAAILIAAPATRTAGLIFGLVIIAAAAWTVLRHREFKHLRPLGVFAVLLALAEIAG